MIRATILFLCTSVRGITSRSRPVLHEELSVHTESLQEEEDEEALPGSAGRSVQPVLLPALPAPRGFVELVARLEPITIPWYLLIGLSVLVVIGLTLIFWPRHRSGTKALQELLDEEERLQVQLESLRASRQALEDEALEGEKESQDLLDRRGLNAAVDKLMARRLGGAVASVKDVMQRKAKLQELLTARYETERQRVTTAIEQSAAGLLDDVKKLGEGTDLSTLSVSEDDTAPVALVLAGLVAPAQLWGLVVLNRMVLCWHLLLVGFDAAILAMSHDAWSDFRRACADAPGSESVVTRQIVWVGSHAGLHAIMLLLRLWVEGSIRGTYARIANRAAKPSMEWVGPFGLLLQADIDNPRALFLVDTIHGSAWYNLAHLLLVVDFLWNMVGVAELFEEAEYAEIQCSANYPMHVAIAVYSIGFVLFFFMNVTLVVLFVIFKVLLRPAKIAKTMRSARRFDTEYMPDGFPLCSLLLRIFVFRDVRDLQRFEEQCLALEEETLAAEMESVAKEAERIRAEREQLNVRRQNLRNTGQEVMASEEQFTKKWLGNLKELEGDGKGGDLTELLQNLRGDVECALESQEAQSLASQAQVMYETAKGAALESEAGQVALASAQAAYDVALEQVQVAASSEAAKAAVVRAKSAYDQAVESEAGQEALASAQAAYETAQKEAEASAMKLQEAKTRTIEQLKDLKEV